MAGITTAECTSFKVEKFKAIHDFTSGTGDTFKCALFRAGSSIAGTYGAATTNYSDMTGNADETTGTNYTAGGKTLTSVTPTTDGTTAVCDFSDITWAAASFTARGFMIYNSSKANRAVCVVDFGVDKVVSAGNFTIYWPTPDASNAIIREA